MRLKLVITPLLPTVLILLVACGGTQPLPDIDATVEARVVEERITEEMGVKIAANVVLLGMFVAATGLLSKEAVEESISAFLRPHTVDAGLRCFAEGYNWYTAA